LDLPCRVSTEHLPQGRQNYSGLAILAQAIPEKIGESTASPATPSNIMRLRRILKHGMDDRAFSSAIQPAVLRLVQQAETSSRGPESPRRRGFQC